jgi:hypothetical protein
MFRMSFRRCFLAALIAASPFQLHAQTPPGLATNGCGAKGWSNFVVPDAVLGRYCQFKSSCNKHDLCYSRCLEGGDLHGSPACADEAQRSQRRAVCDARLHDDILQDNAGRASCASFAKIYRWAVERFGAGAFKGYSSETAKLDAIEKFVDYMVLNPQAFDVQAVDRVFADASAPGLRVTSIEFIPGIPRLRISVVAANGPSLIELKGAAAK